MDSRKRETIIRAVREHPGAHLRELEAITGLGLGGLRHHLDRLEKQGVIRHEFDMRFKRFFPAALSPDIRRIMAALRQTPLRRVATRLLGTPGQRLTELATRLRIPPSSMSAYLRRLETLRVVQTEAGSWSLLHPDAVRQALADLKPGPLDRLVDSTLALMEEEERGQQGPNPASRPSESRSS